MTQRFLALRQGWLDLLPGPGTLKGSARFKTLTLSEGFWTELCCTQKLRFFPTKVWFSGLAGTTEQMRA